MAGREDLGEERSNKLIFNKFSGKKEYVKKLAYFCRSF